MLREATMKKTFALTALVVLLSAGVGSWASPEKKVGHEKATVGGMSSWSRTVTFKAGEPAYAIVVGDGNSHLGLYVLDEHGNCLARDDAADAKFLDDRWVIWHPTKTQRYTIEVRNLGPQADTFHFALP